MKHYQVRAFFKGYRLIQGYDDIRTKSDNNGEFIVQQVTGAVYTDIMTFITYKEAINYMDTLAK